jgi:hypothetical protein
MALADKVVSFYNLDGNSSDAVGSNNGTDTQITYGYGYTDTSNLGSILLNSTGNTRAGMTHIGDGTALNSTKFYLRKTGSPTGNANVKVYAMSGTFGSNGVPTGSVLATSGNLDVSTLTTSNQWITFTFDGSFTPTNGTPYCFELNYSGGDGSNGVNIVRSTGSLPAGNRFIYSGSYSGDNTLAFLYEVHGVNNGKINQGAGFNGSSSKIVFSAVNGTTNMSLSIRFKTTQTPSGSNPMIWGMTGSPALFRIAIPNGTGHIAGFCQDSNSNITSAETTGNYNDGNWHLAVLTKSGNTVILDIDNGTERITAGAVTYTGNFNSMTPRMGTYNGVTEFYSGSADIGGYFDETLTTDDISQLWNDGDGMQWPFSIYAAAFTPLSLNFTIPSITATFQRVATAAFTPLSLLLTIPANTASYVYEQAASFTSLSLKQTIPAITASFENIKLAVFTPLSIIFNIPIFRHWENQIKHISSISNINKMGAGWIYNDNDLTYNMPELYYNSFGGVINFTNQTKHTATIKNLRK